MVGWDKAQVLRHALERGAIHEGDSGPVPRRRRRGFNLRGAAGGAHHRTAAGNRAARLAGCAGHRCGQHEARGLRGGGGIVSTKAARISSAAIPMAGKEISGIAAADANLFRGSKYALIRAAAREEADKQRDPRVAEFVALHRETGRGADLAGRRSARPRRGGGLALAATARRGARGSGPRARPTKPACRSRWRAADCATRCAWREVPTRCGATLFSRTATIWSACWIR